ncbi:pilus assembly protein TadG-related protein [Agromyces albus]|uniref:pilus assembly protein TadG-related protein n=1 Tax=Agromyces albus TaxID=205332 RepID=UPI0027836423|nr:pilus assembly protein TadG-related protein [Agromyces albus]MDQ0573784.1 Flp pilus assembly protein TadG [Agromyces albus]
MMFALAIIPLLACAALAGDTGLLYWEKAQLQNGADAGAIAVASDCAKHPGLCEGRAETLATSIAGENANDGTSVAAIDAITVNAGSGSVKVDASSPSGDGVEHPFASVFFPQDATTLQATATAAWGTPVRGTTKLALTIAQCEFVDLPPQDADAPNPTRTWLLINNGGSGEPCADGSPGGFGWLDGSGCSATISINSTVGGEVGVQPNPNKNGCSSDVIEQTLCQTVLIPLYASSGGSGSHATFTISRFAAFKLTGVKTGGANSARYCGGSPLSPSLPNAGNSKGIQGYFVRYVELGEDFELGNGPNGGLIIVRFSG